MADAKVKCIVVTPERTVLEAEADFVALPAFDGEVGVYPGRLPLVARLACGELRLTTGGQSDRYYIAGGFGQVRGDTVTVLTSSASPRAEIDLANVERELAAVATTTPFSDTEFDAKFARLDAARAQRRLAGKTA